MYTVYKTVRQCELMVLELTKTTTTTGGSTLGGTHSDVSLPKQSRSESIIVGPASLSQSPSSPVDPSPYTQQEQPHNQFEHTPAAAATTTTTRTQDRETRWAKETRKAFKTGIQYVGAFLIVWVPVLFVALGEDLGFRIPYLIWLIDAFMLPLVGLLNACVYSGFVDSVQTCFQKLIERMVGCCCCIPLVRSWWSESSSWSSFLQWQITSKS